MFALAVLLVQTASPVLGLSRDEAWRELAPLAERELPRAHGRLIDATTGEPVEGATIEAWTEDDTVDAVLVGTTESARDGGFALRTKTAGLDADKIRIRSASHRGTVISASDLPSEVLLLPRPAPIAARIVDVNGQPIAGARVRTHQTCAHAPPASSATSGASGIVRLDDFPPFAEHAELQLEADGFESLFDDDPLTTWCESDIDELSRIWLGRRRPIAARFVDSSGSPARGLRVHFNQEPGWMLRHTDASGRVVFESPRSRQFVLLTQLAGESSTAFEGWASSIEPTLRLGGNYAVTPGRLSAWLRVSVEPSDRPIPLLVLHDSGWFATEAGEHAFPPGKLRVFCGADFSGWQPQVEDLELAAGETRTLELHPEPEPVLILRPRVQDGMDVVVEGGGDSVRVATKEWEPRISVPAFTELVVLRVSQPVADEGDAHSRFTRAVHRSTVGGIDKDIQEVQLGHGAPLEQFKDRSNPNAQTASLRFRVPVALADSISIHVLAAGGEIESDAVRAAGFVARVFPRAAFEAWISAPGHVTRAVVGFAPGGDSARDIDAALEPVATIRLSGKFAWAREGGEDIEGTESEPASTLREWTAAPGLHTLEIGLAEGRRIAADVVLQAGETRELRVQ